jgi:broad specificity phosphatase PhoE
VGIVIVARHCQTDWNADRRIQGQRQTPLNEEGRRQANALATLLLRDTSLNIQFIYASDLARSEETADIIWRRFNHRPHVVQDERLRECAFGRLEGKTNEQIEREHAFRPDRTRDSDYDFTTWGGEKRIHVLTRQLSFLSDIRPHIGEGPPQVLIIGHGRSLGTLIRHFKAEDRLEQGSYQLLTV